MAGCHHGEPSNRMVNSARLPKVLDPRDQLRFCTGRVATGFIGKLGWELATGSTLFVYSVAANFTPLPLSHVVGGIVGVLVWFAAQISCKCYSARL
jgi:hypothetical protein